MKSRSDFLELQTAVFGRQNILAKVYQTAGSLSLFDYVNLWQIAGLGREAEEFLGVLQDLLSQIYPPVLCREIIQQLGKFPLVSTIDHHGLLNHPFFINADLIFSLKAGLRYLPCLSTAGVSLNNSSWPGSLVFNSQAGGLKRFSFFPDKIKTACVFSAPALGRQNLEKVSNAIKAEADLSGQEKIRLGTLAEAVFAGPEIERLANFSAQACLLSFRLWREFFPRAPQVVYLPVEDLAAKLIVKVIAPRPKHVLHQLLFTAQGWTLIEKYFNQTLGAFSSSHKGSFLFWGIDQKGRRVHLRRQGSRIKDEKFLDLELSPEVIAQALENRQLYPTTLVCFLILLYYQITCLGGFNQVNWLSGIKEKFLLLLKEMEQVDLAEKVEGVPTKNFAEGNLAFLNRGGQLIKATGLDLYLTGQDYYQKYLTLAKNLTVAESIGSLLPEIYRVIIPAGERNQRLLALNDLDVMKINGSYDKILNLVGR